MMLLTDQRQPFVDLLEKAVNTSGIRPYGKLGFSVLYTLLTLIGLILRVRV